MVELWGREVVSVGDAGEEADGGETAHVSTPLHTPTTTPTPGSYTTIHSHNSHSIFSCVTIPDEGSTDSNPKNT